MQTIEVAIGLVAYFLLMSLVASAIIDLLETRLRKKGRTLLKAVRTACGSGHSFTTVLYTHPQIEILFEGDTANTGAEVEDCGTLKALFRWEKSLRGLPSYIPNPIFARAFLETLVGCKPEQISDLSALFAEEKRPWRIEGENTPTGIHSEELDDAYRVMRPLVIEAGGDTNATLALLATHFEKVNDRAKGWYKRWVTRCLFAVGLLIALGTNGDAIRMVNRLNSNPALRQSMVQLAESYAKQDPGLTPEVLGNLTNDSKVNNQRRQILKDLESSEAISGGWANDPLLTASGDRDASLFLLKVLGLFITGAAISLGAPFWFHVLQSLLKLRGAVGGKAEEGEGKAGSTETKSVEEAKAELTQAARTQAAAAPPLKAVIDCRSAAELADLSRLAYLPLREFSAKLAFKPLQPVELVNAQTKADRGDGTLIPVDTQAYVVRTAERLLIVFRGTEPKVPADLITDARFKLVSAPWLQAAGGDVLIHGGFKAALEAVWPRLRAQWTLPEIEKNGVQVVFCGHSLGGALAVLAAARFQAEDPQHRLVFGGLHTIGQPRVGNKAFATWAARLFAGRYLRAINNRDAVPRVPPAAMGFEHFGTVHYFDSEGLLHEDPSWFFRFLDYSLPPEQLQNLSGHEWVRTLKEAGSDHSSDDYAALYARNSPGVQPPAHASAGKAAQAAAV